MNFLSKLTGKRRWKRLGKSSVTALTPRWRSDGQGWSGGGGSFKKWRHLTATALNSYFAINYDVSGYIRVK